MTSPTSQSQARPCCSRVDDHRSFLPRSTGRSSPRSTSSRPTSTAPVACCARAAGNWCCRKSGDICAATTRSARSCSMPPRTAAATPTVSHSSPPCGSAAARSPSRAPFPPQHTDRGNILARLWRHGPALASRRRRAHPPAAPQTTTPSQPPRRQTQVHPLARQTRTPPRLAPTQRRRHRYHPNHLTAMPFG